MNYSEEELAGDVARVGRIPIVPTLLDVICQTTGMGFAAVARVTDDRWITCSVRDDIQFGLLPGSELEIKTTICDEIRQSHQPVVINHVMEDPFFSNHHTPAMYGFQSYISFPIFLKSGTFFGTLCAIDPKPAELDNSKIRGMFAAFAELISFHLQQIELLEQSDHAVKSLSRQLTNAEDENRQYRHISSHTLQEPLRKLRTFSGMLAEAIRNREIDKAEHLASRISSGAERFSALINDLSSLAKLETDDTQIQLADLQYIVGVVCAELRPKLEQKNGQIRVGILPRVIGIPVQLEQLFYQLLDNAIKFAKEDIPLSVSIISTSPALPQELDLVEHSRSLIEIKIADNGIGIAESQLESIFDMFSRLPSRPVRNGLGMGLTLCRKIVRNHSGLITISSQENVGTTVSVILPVAYEEK